MMSCVTICYLREERKNSVYIYIYIHKAHKKNARRFDSPSASEVIIKKNEEGHAQHVPPVNYFTCQKQKYILKLLLLLLLKKIFSSSSLPPKVVMERIDWSRNADRVNREEELYKLTSKSEKSSI